MVVKLGIIGYRNHAKRLIDIIESEKGLQETGGTMRLGGYRCSLAPNSLARKIYGKEEIIERHRHRYEFNDYFKENLNSNGFITSGICPDNNLALCLFDHGQ